MLEIKNLSVNGILKNANLVVQDGARMLFRGANGAGKTTLIQAIMGNPDYAPTSGEIIFDGANITGKAADERARMGIFVGAQNVPEIPGLAVMTFLKHAFQARFGERPMSEFIKKLKPGQARLGIPDAWLARGVNVGFSGGEKKRLMFLHLILSEPKLAILDEPDSGADKETQKLFSEIIDDMLPTAFLVASHLDVMFEPTAETFLQNGEIMVK